MYRFPLSRKKADPDRLQEIQLDLLGESRFDSPYLVLIISSCAIATFGLLANSAAVIIGAMIIAPLMMPIRGLAFGALAGDVFLFKKGVIAVAIGTVIAIAISYGLGRIVGLPSYGSEVWARSAPTLLDLGVAVAAGGISGYAKVEPKISASLAGTAIAVALMPPVCVVGLGLASGDLSLSWGATLLYLTNLLGIALSCMLAFVITGYASFRRAKKVIVSTFVFTAALVLPLGISFARLVQQAHLETSLRRALVDRTLTFQRLGLVNSETNWLARPPEIRLQVRSKEPITPRQVALLEEFIEREMGQKFVLIFEVGKVEEIRREETEEPEKSP